MFQTNISIETVLLRSILSQQSYRTGQAKAVVNRPADSIVGIKGKLSAILDGS